jgi:hypothetical protein
MKGRLLAAGWPFAGLLALDAVSEEVPDAAPVQGLIVQNGEGGVLLLEPGDAVTPLAVGPTTRFYGVDGYPIGRGDVHTGDEVEAVQQKVGAEWATTKVRVVRRAPSMSSSSY